MDFFKCIALKDALSLMLDKVAGLTVAEELVGLGQALGRVVAKELIVNEDLPPFSRSTVDGFAVRSADTFGAGEGVPALLLIVDEVVMGQQALIKLQPGQAAAIPTGGMLPEGADAVVMIEHTERPDADTVMLVKAVAPGENIVIRGDDIRAGNIVVQQGRKIRPQDIGALAACGFVSVPVRVKPKVAVISTGDELVDVGCILAAGQIRDVNSYVLAAMLEESGCTVRHYGIIKDRYEDLLAVLAKAVVDCQMVIVSGGSSVGARDHTVRVIEELGKSEALFHGVAVKPGKPTIFGMVDAVPVFGLPGHPVAAMTVGRLIVNPVIKTLLGEQQRKIPMLVARMIRSVASAPGRDDVIRVRISRQGDEYLADPVLGKSGLISTMVQADGLVRISAAKSGLYDGDIVEVEAI